MVGLSSRAVLFEPTYRVPRKGKGSALFVEFSDRLATFQERIERTTKALLVNPAVQQFVQETLGLRWPWVGIELLDGFYRNVYAIATGQVIVRTLWAEPIYLRAPSEWG